jgi:hypothetical protein
VVDELPEPPNNGFSEPESEASDDLEQEKVVGAWQVFADNSKTPPETVKLYEVTDTFMDINVGDKNVATNKYGEKIGKGDFIDEFGEKRELKELESIDQSIPMRESELRNIVDKEIVINPKTLKNIQEDGSLNPEDPNNNPGSPQNQQPGPQGMWDQALQGAGFVVALPFKLVQSSFKAINDGLSSEVSKSMGRSVLDASNGTLKLTTNALRGVKNKATKAAKGVGDGLSEHDFKGSLAAQKAFNLTSNSLEAIKSKFGHVLDMGASKVKATKDRIMGFKNKDTGKIDVTEFEKNKVKTSLYKIDQASFAMDQSRVNMERMVGHHRNLQQKRQEKIDQHQQKISDMEKKLGDIPQGAADFARYAKIISESQEIVDTTKQLMKDNEESFNMDMAEFTSQTSNLMDGVTKEFNSVAQTVSMHPEMKDDVELAESIDLAAQAIPEMMAETASSSKRNENDDENNNALMEKAKEMGERISQMISSMLQNIASPGLSKA